MVTSVGFIFFFFFVVCLHNSVLKHKSQPKPVAKVTLIQRQI